MSLRDAITSAYRRPEPECLPPLITAATLPAETMARATALARQLVERQRAKGPGHGVEGLIHEYSLASEEGVALMCLAEALLRIPDDDTRDALIRDKIGGGDWRAHLGQSPSLFVNAATWGLLLTGRLTSTHSERGLSSALTRLVAKGGEPLIRAGVNLAMRLMGEQFVSGQTIGEALANGRPWVAKGFRYSYDMLGEAAVTMAQAERYFAEYENAIGAIGAESAGRGLYDGPGISIKLSALHPRYTRSQIERVQTELYPRLKALAVLARSVDIGLNIDAEEADRLEISLDLLERLCFEPELAGWHGIGFVVQAYQKRCSFVIDWLVDLAARSGHRLMVRLVKGAYWDGEIKRAQVDGLEGFPVFTRKIHTDVSYIACARQLLAATDRVFPQFATHNASTLATLYGIAPKGQYEFQCLHGMGESLYEEVVGSDKLDVPCRIYAPVGTHETLLAYLVRRLLENGANTSFVNQIADPDFPIDKLLADPVERARALQPVGRPHDRIALPRELFEERVNSTGFDISNEHRLAELSAAMAAAPTIEVASVEVDDACRTARPWTATPQERADCLTRIAGVLEARRMEVIPTIVREAGKTTANAVGEVREAADFLRYYAAQVRDWSNDTHKPLGIVACISPWNFPLSIFTGQIAGALAAGNGVVAKPAEETPKIASQAVALFRDAGLPLDVLQLVIGDGAVGAQLVADKTIEGVVFTGSTQAAQSINRTLAKRPVVPFIAETGGQNVMVVDSSALPEQLVVDALTSAFDSAGQRCSALRVLALQEDIAGHVLPMLKEAMAELSVGDPALLSTDVGPVITEEAQKRLLDHIAAMRAKGRRVTQTTAPGGLFVPPTLIEIQSIAELPGEVFGPVMHVLRYPREGLDRVIREANATGFGLTFGVHSRIDETIDRATDLNAAGNQYVNRTVIGAVVGVQPFGGHGLSGTGPKAGGPLYVRRLLAEAPPLSLEGPSLEGMPRDLPGPVGERNTWRLRPKGTILCVANDPADLQAQVEIVGATGNRVTQDVDDPQIGAALFAGSREALRTLARRLAARDGPIVPLHLAPYRREALLDEVSLSVNTAAAGGNANLMTIG
jgi:RHH-type transcriptional regulator, proline utilization regulon repressor / proline dehydrogenase / delta 1-pyrroline-5-carboxylate dehydrogenase